MADFSNPHLTQIIDFLTESLNHHTVLSESDIDAREIVFQIGQEVRRSQVKWTDGMVCVPNVVRILLLEEKADKTEAIEMLFSSPTFINHLTEYLQEEQLHLIMPLRVEVELVSKGSSRLMYSAGRCLLQLDWPLAEEADLVNIVIDDIKKQVLEVQERKPQIPMVARLTALNVDVYRNNFYITKEITYLGRLRVVRDSETGRFLRRNDFVFSQLEDPKAVNNSISRQHAKIEFRKNAFYLVDQGSANSTAVERGKTGAFKTFGATKEGIELQDGDILLLGSARVRFNITDHVDTAAVVLQREQDRLAEKLERSAPQKTTKLPLLSSILGYLEDEED